MNTLKIIDYHTGLLRAWGLILYATLPSSLALLNILEIKTVNTAFRIEYLVFALLPFTVLYVLILSKQKSWFLEKRHLHFRTVFTLLIILIVTTSICGMSLLIKNNYHIDFSLEGIKGIMQSFLMAISCLVVSAALFLTVLTKNDNLPGIPSVRVIESNTKTQERIREIVSEIETLTNIGGNEKDNDIEKIIMSTSSFKSELQKFISDIPNYMKSEFNNLLFHVVVLDKLIVTIKKTNHPETKEKMIDQLKNVLKKKAIDKDISTESENSLSYIISLKI